MSSAQTVVGKQFTASLLRVDNIERMVDACEAHGTNSDPGNEPGALQECLRATWGLMDDKQKLVFLTIDPVISVMEGVEGKMPAADSEIDIENFLNAVESDFEHLEAEVDDLRALLRVCGTLMTQEQINLLPEQDDIKKLIEE